MSQKEADNGAKITVDEILLLQEKCMNLIRCDELYDIRNSAKLRAVTSTKTYDEFKDIVDAAHLQPLSKFDKSNAKLKHNLWNVSSR